MWKIAVPVAICAASAAYGQSAGTITGRVVEEGAQQGLSASITVVTTGAGVRLRSIPTDDRGTFTVEAAPGSATVIARADGYASEQREILIRPGRANPTLHFALPRAASLSGRVVDQSGAGVAGARVWVQYRGEARAWRFAEEAASEETDAAGNFTIPMVAQGRAFVLHTESEGWLPSSSQTMMVRSPELPGVLLLISRRGGSVSGRVLDSGGRPVAGARVRLRAQPEEPEFTPELRRSPAFARAMNKVEVSGPDGSYSFRGVPGGRAVLTAEAQNGRGAAEAAMVAGERAIVDIVLR